jgi:acyl-CoA reductase-like NAD-dependent aldehyde dehydrogenase
MLRPIVGGREREGEGAFKVLRPFDGSVYEEIVPADASLIDEAFALCDGTRGVLKAMTRAQRSEVLFEVSRRLGDERERLAAVLASEAGKTIREARTEVDRAANTFRFAGEEARRLGGDVVPFDAVAGGAGRRGFSIKVPIGTVIAITPFNFPLNLAAHKIAPAMAAGNPFILKPASQTPVSGLELVRIILESGWPPDGAHVLPGRGAAIGDSLVADPRGAMVTFTGSAAVGKRISSLAGYKRIAMELGSNSAVVVTETADLEFAAERIVRGGFALAGQVCISVQRVIAQKQVFEDLVRRCSSITARMNVGDPMDEATDMGPMIDEKAAAGFHAWVEEAGRLGAELVTGGGLAGTLHEPTIMTNVPREAALWREEAFGPVIVINPYDNFDEAVEAVNDSRYGLQGGIFTSRLDEAFTAADRFEVGGVIINDVPTFRVDQMPYGGVKDSGIGREGLKYAIQEMTEDKLVCFNFWKP